MAKHTTYFFSKDARAQAEFYIHALGGEIVSIMTHGQLPDASEEMKDKVMHLSLVAAGATFYMTDEIFGSVQPGNNIYQSLEFATEEEAHQAFNRLAEDGTIRYPLTPAFWGALHGQVQDKFDVLWMITTEAKPQS
ncbi:VOC family protein [Paenibacillus hexagrammi]|uniref:VOC family protein n=1 Tax=Paenibacillus hexagrammi TaxID=2908839 RepID=A0ABY3SIU4_9BACL|nr:VOC family protein [Paenibacillus sp. YPD9-1]UJF33866.1 VOC family protein [Paenibacillus sp. YPD9-1]